MQYYTKQELQGAGRYTGKCRIGNWNENDTLDEVSERHAHTTRACYKIIPSNPFYGHPPTISLHFLLLSD